jgi:hypothetical protein
MLEASSNERALGIPLVQTALPVGKICFLLVLVFDILVFVGGQNSDYLFILHYTSLLIFFYSFISYRSTVSYTTKRIKNLMYLFIVVQLLIWLTGVFSVSEYFDYKKVWVSPSGGLAILCSVFILSGIKPGLLLPHLPFFLKVLKFLFVPVLLLTFRLEEAFARGFASIYLFLLVIYYLPKKHRPWIIGIAVASIVFGLSWRANVLRIVFCMFLVFLPLVFKKRLVIIQKYILYFLVVFPVILAIMSFEGLNIFYVISQMGDILPSGISDFKDDTRTFLYMEVINDLSDTNTLWFGKGVTGKYYSEFFELVEGRMGVEVAFLAILLTSGIFGMVIYSSVILVALYVGFFKSNNQLSKLFALFLAFHWFMIFVEVIPTFNQYYFLLWIIVGLSLSSKFRQMNDAQVTQLINRKSS